MSQRDKLVRRLRSLPKDFSWDEASSLLGQFGFEELKTGKTGGSRRKFYDPALRSLIMLHKPHPGRIMKPGAVAYLLETLIDCGYIKEEQHEQE